MNASGFQENQQARWQTTNCCHREAGLVGCAVSDVFKDPRFRRAQGDVTFDIPSDDDSMPLRQVGKEEEFIRLLTPSYRAIYAYARTLLSNTADAEDCVQEASLLLWHKFDDFDRNGSFTRWARGFIRRIVKNYRRKSRPDSLSLDGDLIDRLMVVQSGLQELLELRRERLLECLERLSAAERKLLGRYYESGETVTDLAQSTGRTPAAIYQTLRRTRLALFSCVDRHLGRGE